jgi:hypothetical protein
MRELIFEVEFLSDIVLPATSNNEGNIKQLDFISGSNFLGMVAKNYDKFGDSFKVFHSGAVKFGDGVVLKDNKPTYKMPLSFFHEKLDDSKIFNHHKIEDFSKFIQLKQKRSGYITYELEVAQIDYNYSQKSAYDKTKRRSKDSSMYGYNAIQSGTNWQFSIKVDVTISSNDIELIKSNIIGNQRLGKSKSSQYGLVNINFIEDKNIQKSTQKYSNSVIIYAKSRLALVDDDGNATYDLKYLFECLNDNNIDYNKTQIRTSSFTPYNRTRQTKDYERLCINSGSVIVLKDLKDIEIPNFVGAYQSDGFGEILINPSFLEKNGFELKKESNKQETKEPIQIITPIAKFLEQRENSKNSKLDLAKSVSKFINNNKKVYDEKMNSQWGAIRSLCSNNTNETIKDKVEDYISHGVAKTKWEGNKKTTLLNAIENSQNPLEFTKLLSMQMPKVKNKEQKND